MRSRATNLLPSVLLTLLSMIQALALELLWSRLRESPYLWVPGWEAVLGWIQVAVMLLGLFQVWFFYSSLVMRLSWVPALQDSILPFGIGVLEFTLIDLMGTSLLGAWFGVLSAVFATSIGASYTIFRRARRDPANREFFGSVAPARLRDFIPSAAVVGALAIMGLVLHVSGSRGWLALVALLIAGAALVQQIALTNRYWVSSMGESRSSGAPA